MLILKTKIIKRRMRKILYLENSIIKFNKLQICGKNGSGKSTLLNEIWNHNQKYLNDTVSFVFQKFMLINELTIIENLELLTPHTLEISELYFKIFPELNKNQQVAKLSGGQKQVLNFLISFINDKNIILIDEPFNNLDTSNRKYIENLIRNSDKKIIVVAHGYNFDWCEKKIEINNGKLKELV